MSRPAAPRTRIDLLRAAEAAFAQHGLAAAKVEEITARAGVSKGAFYLHFQSKEDCFKQIAEGFLARLGDCVEPPPDASEAAPVDAATRLREWYEHDLVLFEFCWQNRALLRMILEGSHGTTYAYLVDEFSGRAKRLVEGWVRHGISSGIYRDDLDLDVVSALVSGAYDRLARELIRQPQRPDIAAWCAQALGLFSRGLLRDDARAILDRQVNHGPRAPEAAGAPKPVRSRTAPAVKRAERTKRARAS